MLTCLSYKRALPVAVLALAAAFVAGCSKPTADVATPSLHQAVEAPKATSTLTSEQAAFERGPLTPEALAYQAGILKVISAVQSASSQEVVIAAVTETEIATATLARSIPKEGRGLIFNRVMRETLKTADLRKAFFTGVMLAHKPPAGAPPGASAPVIASAPAAAAAPATPATAIVPAQAVTK